MKAFPHLQGASMPIANVFQGLFCPSATCSVATSRAPKSVSTAVRGDVVEEVLCARLREKATLEFKRIQKK